MLLDILQALTGVFRVVFEGEHAVKFTLGEAGEVVGPGIHFKWPIFQKFVVRCTRDTALQLQKQTVQIADNLVYNFSAAIIYRIVDLRAAVVEISDLKEGLTNLVETSIQQVLRSTNRDLNNQEIINKVVKMIMEKLAGWGVEIIHFGFTELSPTAETSKIIQTELLSKARFTVYQELVAKGLAPSVAASLVSGAAMIVAQEEKKTL